MFEPQDLRRILIGHIDSRDMNIHSLKTFKTIAYSANVQNFLYLGVTEREPVASVRKS